MTDALDDERHCAETSLVAHSEFFDGREMLMVHRAFRREFAVAPGLVRPVDDGDTLRCRRNVSIYYQATGAEFAEAQAARVNVGPDGVKSAVATFEALGADELILHPAVPVLDEIEALAKAVL